MCIGKFFIWLFSLFIGAELDALVPAVGLDDEDDDDVDADVDADDEDADADADEVDAAAADDVDALGPAIPLVDGSSAVLLLLQLRHPMFWLVLPDSWREFIGLGCIGALIISRNLRSCEQRFAEFPCELLNMPWLPWNGPSLGTK